MNDERRLERIENKIDKVLVEQAAQHVTLLEHTRRSTQLEHEFIPMRRFMNRLQGAIGLVLGLGACAELIHLFWR